MALSFDMCDEELRSAYVSRSYSSAIQKATEGISLQTNQCAAMPINYWTARSCDGVWLDRNWEERSKFRGVVGLRVVVYHNTDL